METNVEDSNPRPPDDTSAIQPNGWLGRMLVWIRLHFSVCCWCERYMKQLHYIRETARRFPEHADEASDPVLSPEARFRLKHVLNRQ